MHYEGQAPTHLHLQWAVASVEDNRVDSYQTQHACFAGIRPLINVSSFYVGARGKRAILLFEPFERPAPVCSETVAW